MNTSPASFNHATLAERRAEVHTIAVISQKGGAGKTTLTVCIAVAAHRAGLSVLVVDLDPQSTSAAVWGGQRTDDEPVVIRALPTALGAVLAAAVEQSADLVLIDTPPRAEASQSAAAKHADLVLVPFLPSLFDTSTVGTTLDVVKLANPPPKQRPLVIGVLNQVPARGSARTDAEADVASLDLTLSPAVLGQRAAFVAAIRKGRTPQETEPSGKAASEIELLYDYVMQQLPAQVEPEQVESRAEPLSTTEGTPS